MKWNFYTTNIALNNFAMYSNTPECRTKRIEEICDRIEAYIPCDNKEQIIEDFKKDVSNVNSSTEFKEKVTNLILVIKRNFVN